MLVSFPAVKDIRGDDITSPTIVLGDVTIATDGVTFVDLDPLPTITFAVDGSFTMDVPGVTASTVIKFVDQTNPPAWYGPTSEDFLSIDPSGNYTNVARLYDMFGEANVTLWASLDNEATATEIDDRIRRRSEAATAYVNDQLRGKYSVPFDPVPETIADITTAIAGQRLYTKRGIENEDKTVLEAYTEAKKTLNQIKRGLIELDSTNAITSPATDLDTASKVTVKVESPLYPYFPRVG